MDGWMDGWMDGRTDEQMDGSQTDKTGTDSVEADTDRQTYSFIVASKADMNRFLTFTFPDVLY